MTKITWTGKIIVEGYRYNANLERSFYVIVLTSVITSEMIRRVGWLDACKSGWLDAPCDWMQSRVGRVKTYESITFESSFCRASVLCSAPQASSLPPVSFGLLVTPVPYHQQLSFSKSTFCDQYGHIREQCVTRKLRKWSGIRSIRRCDRESYRWLRRAR